MKKSILTLAVLASMSSMSAIAAEEAPDMSDPTAVYTTLGFGYGDKGLDLSSMLLLSSTETTKSGIIFDAKNILNEDDKVKQQLTGHEVNNTSYRLRWGQINTQNGLGLTVDAVNLEHSFWGRTTVVQAGTLATLPIGDDLLIFPIAFVGGVLVEDNTLALADAIAAKAAAKTTADLIAAGKVVAAMPEGTVEEKKAKAAAAAKLQAAKDEAIATSAKLEELRNGANMSSEGMSMASTIATGMVYARYAITDKLWALGSFSYTQAIQGKDWDDKVVDGGLQMPEQQYDITIGYQITPTQNITAFYGSDNSSDTDDKWKIGYNYAF